MLGILLKAGYEATTKSPRPIISSSTPADFLEASRQESSDTIDILLKEKKQGAKLVVTGCMVQKHSGELKERFPDIHYFLGSGDVEKILEAIQSPEAGASVTTAKSYLAVGRSAAPLSTPKNYAYLKIAEGCLKACPSASSQKSKGRSAANEDQVIKEFNAPLPGRPRSDPHRPRSRRLRQRKKRERGL